MLASLIPLLSPLRSDLSWITVVVGLTSVFVVSSVFKFVRGLKAIDFLPGLRIPFEPISVLGVILPETWWNPGLLFTWTWRKDRNIYDHYGCDTVSIVPFIGGSPTIYTRSMQVGKQIVVAGHNSGAFGKTEWLSRFFVFWGSNIISADGELWRKHRKLVSPAFNNETYAFVWDTACKLYAEMASAERWAIKDVVEVPSVHVLTFKFTLIMIASIGFGFPFTWANPPTPQGEMSILECLEIITQTVTFAITAPAWVWKLPFPWFRRTRCAYDTMRAFMYTVISTTRETVRSEAEGAETKRTKDLFSLLIRASEGVGGKMSLSDNELIGNIFSFLFAGHETTAHTLAATLAFLALDSDLQDELVAQIREVTQGRDDDALLTADYGKLDKVLAAFYEGIRMFPSGVFLVREAKRDTVLDVSDGSDPKISFVKKGTHLVVDMIGVQYNPRHFSEPDKFRPSRWYRKQKDSNENEELEEYTAFSTGPRACLGRKFASTEGVCFLASLLREWRIEPLLARTPSGEMETVDEWRGRVLQAKIGLAMGINDVPLRFVRRV